MGAVSWTPILDVNPDPDGYVGVSMVIGEVTMSSSYSSGGDTLNVISVAGMNVSGQPFIAKLDGMPEGYTIQPVYQTGGSAHILKFKAFSAAATQVAGGTDLSGSGAKLTFRLEIIAPVEP